MRNNSEAIIEKIKSVLDNEITVVELCKSVSECSVPEIIFAIKRLRYQGHLLGKNLSKREYSDREYFNSLEFWSDVLRPTVIIVGSKKGLQ